MALKKVWKNGGEDIGNPTGDKRLGVSGWVKSKVETANVVRMKAKSKNLSVDLPNQEKNQYWTVYWWEIGTLYTKVKGGSYQKNWIKKITGLLELMEACLKRLWTCKIVEQKMGYLSVYYDSMGKWGKARQVWGDC